MNAYFPVIAFLLFISNICLKAQTQSPEAKSPAVTDPAKHLAQQNAEAAKSPQMRSKALSEMQKRALLVTQNNARFIQDFKAGKAVPFAALRHRYLHEFPMHLSAFKARHSEILTKKDLTPAKRKSLIIALQEALQPIGPYLNAPDYQAADMTLTKQQHAELVRLQKLDPTNQVGKQGTPMMTAQSNHLTYTMLHIPVYLEVKAQPNSTVYFTTDGGGQFGNSLPMQEVKADAQGVASAEWISKGASIGVSGITATSPTSNNPTFFRVEVVGLSLKALPQMPQMPQIKSIKKNSESMKNQIEKLKKQHSSDSNNTQSPTTKP